MKPHGIARGKRKQDHLESEQAIGKQFARLRGEHQEAGHDAQDGTDHHYRQSKPQQRAHWQGFAQTQDPQLNKDEVAQDQAHADQVSHLKHGIGPGVRGNGLEIHGLGSGLEGSWEAPLGGRVGWLAEMKSPTATISRSGPETRYTGKDSGFSQPRGARSFGSRERATLR